MIVQIWAPDKFIQDSYFKLSNWQRTKTPVTQKGAGYNRWTKYPTSCSHLQFKQYSTTGPGEEDLKMAEAGTEMDGQRGRTSAGLCETELTVSGAL